LRDAGARPNVLGVNLTPPISDADLARQRLVEALVATGAEDRTAFRTLYKLTSAKLFGVCLRICGDRQAAEDVLSEVYLTIWKRAGAFEPGRASPISWLATIARNRAIDWRRASGRAPPARVEDIADLADDRASAEDVLLVDEQARALHACLDQLEPRQRDAIRTAFFDGLTYAELAERDAVPLGTMKSWVRRGLIRLKDCLGDDDD
jgi:RNA polymerase sigma-70 factor (ECF subfamily)